MKNDEKKANHTDMSKILGQFNKIIDKFHKLDLGKLHMKFSEDVEITIENKKETVVAPAPMPQMMPAQYMAPQPQMQQAATPAQSQPAEQPVDENVVKVKAPLVGTFYAAPSPDDAPFVKVGDTVSKGQVVCIVESMKVMNEIKATESGVVKEIRLSDGDLVQFDQTILTIGK